jgi:two-component system LytT family sensor kinase
MVTFRLLRYVGVWTLVGVFFFTQDIAQSFYSTEPDRWFLVLECWLLRAYVWGLLAPLVVRIARRIRFADGYSLRWAGAHFGIGSMIAVIAAVLTGCAGNALGIPWYLPDLRAAVLEALAFSFHASLFAYWVIVGACEVFDNYRSSRRAETEATRLKAQLVQSQLHALKHQLQPHFLFNALNAIVALIRRRRNTQAEELTGRLGELLRGAMEETETQEIPLSRELRFLEAYLEIEHVRYGDRLKIDLRIDSEATQALVPYMCLQPLAENAIRHGIASRLPRGTLTVRARVRDAMLEITVADDGVGFDPVRATSRQGIGISNTRARLSHLYGPAAQLNIDSSPGCTLVTLSLPYHLAEVSHPEREFQRTAFAPH